MSFAAKRRSATRMPAPSKSSSTRCRESVGDGEVATYCLSIILLTCSLEVVNTGSTTELPFVYGRPSDRTSRPPISLCRTLDEEGSGVYREDYPHVAAWIAFPGDAHRLTYALGLHRRS